MLGQALRAFTFGAAAGITIDFGNENRLPHRQRGAAGVRSRTPPRHPHACAADHHQRVK